MKKNPASQSGLFNPRVLLAFSLCSVGGMLAMLSFASTPSSGTLTDTSGPQTYTAGPFFVANPTPVIEVDAGPECFGSEQPCDDYALTVTLPSGYAAAHPNAAVQVTMSWTDNGSGASDYDLYIYKNPRSDCSPQDCTSTDGTQAADFQSASSAAARTPRRRASRAIRISSHPTAPLLRAARANSISDSTPRPAAS